MKTARQKSTSKFENKMGLKSLKERSSLYGFVPKYTFTLALFCLVFAGCSHQEERSDSYNEVLQPEQTEIDYPVAEVAILGTFHFQSNVDAYKRKHHLDISSEKTQKEIQELLYHLKRFQPTKIALEVPIKNQERLDSLYQEYRKGNYELPVPEMYQLGFRLAKQLDHPHIYGVDTQAPLHLENRVADWDEYAKETGLYDKWNYFSSYFSEKYSISDSLKTTMPLLEYYSFLNSKEVEDVSGQDKLNGIIQLGAGDTYIGADGMTKDYRRNLRIYANMLSLIESDEDRFLMIYGSSHKRILRRFFEDSIEFTYVDILSYLE